MRNFACAAMLCAFVGCGKPPGTSRSQPEPEEPRRAAPATPESRARERVTRCLDMAKRGQTDTNWRAPSVGETYGPPLRLHAARSFEILSAKTSPAYGSVATQDGMKYTTIVVVRVDSSDPNGRPITRDYRVAVGDDGLAAYLMGAR